VQYSFNYQDAHFTVLDNSRTMSLTSDQMDFLEKDLAANKDKQPKFVFFHKPYWIPLLKLGATDFPLQKLCKKFDVTFVVSGHGQAVVAAADDSVHRDVAAS
jgi:hypothetical protein